MAAAIERKNALSIRIVDNRIRICTSLDGRERSKCPDIENRDLVVAPIAYEAAIQIICHRNTMNAICVRNLPHNGLSVQIDDDHFGAVRDIQAPILDRKS